VASAGAVVAAGSLPQTLALSWGTQNWPSASNTNEVGAPTGSLAAVLPFPTRPLTTAQPSAHCRSSNVKMLSAPRALAASAAAGSRLACVHSVVPPTSEALAVATGVAALVLPDEQAASPAMVSPPRASTRAARVVVRVRFVMLSLILLEIPVEYRAVLILASSCGVAATARPRVVPGGCQRRRVVLRYNQMVVYQVSDAEVDRVFHALADATRRDIVRRVAVGEQSITDLARRYPMSMTAVQKHVLVLEEAGLVSKRRHGREQRVLGRVEALHRAQQLLDDYERLWRARFDRIGDLLAEPTEEGSS
jgi:DNA-binding transcriptional ArsR family regulator